MSLSVREYVHHHDFSVKENRSEVTNEDRGMKLKSAMSKREGGGLTCSYRWSFPKLAKLENSEVTLTARYMTKNGSFNERVFTRLPENPTGSSLFFMSSDLGDGWENRSPVAEFTFRITAQFPEPQEKRRDFSGPGLSDVVLRVGAEQFHVSKMVLAIHSPYFNTLFHGPFCEAQQSEIELKGIDPVIFQQLLQIIYHCPDINEDNVEKLLEMARMYDLKPVTKQCATFLNGQNLLTNGEKLVLKRQFGLRNVLIVFR